MLAVKLVLRKTNSALIETLTAVCAGTKPKWIAVILKQLQSQRFHSSECKHYVMNLYFAVS